MRHNGHDGQLDGGASRDAIRSAPDLIKVANWRAGRLSVVEICSTASTCPPARIAEEKQVSPEYTRPSSLAQPATVSARSGAGPGSRTRAAAAVLGMTMPA